MLFLHLVSIVTTKRRGRQETVGRKPWSSKTKRKLSQQRASRSHRQQRPPPPPHANAVERPAARRWTWVLQPTTLETRAQRRRYPQALDSRLPPGFCCLHTFNPCFHSLQSTGSKSSSSGLADLLVIDPSSNQSAAAGNCSFSVPFCLKMKFCLLVTFVSTCSGVSSDLIAGFADFSSPAASASLPTSTGKLPPCWFAW